jgi:Ca2+-binding EF-hand superfamily protein
MALSMVKTIKILTQKKSNLSLDELIYVLKTLKENTKNDEVHRFLENVIPKEKE